MNSPIVSLSTEKLNIVVAYTSKSRFIGYRNDLPWKRLLKGDKNFLKNIIDTKGGSKVLLITGRVTFEKLPKFKNVEVAVISSNEDPAGSETRFRTFGAAVEFGKAQGYAIVVFGGENVFKEALQFDHRIFCTVVEEGNTADSSTFVDEIQLLGDRCFPPCSTPLSNITAEVEHFLLARGVTKTWRLENNCFLEDGFKYTFNIGE